jgi:hypothetical protein
MTLLFSMNLGFAWGPSSSGITYRSRAIRWNTVRVKSSTLTERFMVRVPRFARVAVAVLAFLLLSACATTPAGPRSIVMADGFVVLVMPDRPSIQRACDRLNGALPLPGEVGGCYHGARDIGVVLQGDAIAIRHELCHHRDIHHRGEPGWLSEMDCTERWHY